MLRGILRVARDAPSEIIRDALRARVQAQCPDRFDAVYPYLCKLLSLSLEDEYDALRSLQGESLRAEVFWAVQTLVESAARRQPLIMVCEDLHWADATSLALLEHVLALTDQAALLTICVFRPEVEHPCWQLKEMAARLYRHRYTDLWLDALSADESRVLVRHLLRIEDLPAALRTKILDRAEGNPFYVEEILRTLIDDGAIVCDDAGPSTGLRTGHWRATREIADIPIPHTLHGVLAARIDRLQEETRRVLRLASVIGRVFPYHVLAEIGKEEQQLDTRLLTLQRQQLIRERTRVPEREYIFKHELTREAAYNGLLKRDRRACHRQVAETLERLFPEQVDEQAGLLAHHWERAEEPEKAIEYLLRAGEQARLAYANEEAIDYFQRALASMDPCPSEARQPEWQLTALSGLGKVYFDSGRVNDAEAPLREAIALAKAMGKPVRERVRLSWWLGEVLFWQQRFEDMLHLGEEGLALLADDDETLEAALMNQVIAMASGWMGNHDKYFEFTDRTARFLKDLPYVEELRPPYTHVVESSIAAKRVEDAKQWLAAYEAEADRAHHLRGLGGVNDVYASLFFSIGDLQRAADHWQRAVQFHSRINDAKHQAQCLLDLGNTYLSLGHIEEAERHIQRVLALVNAEDFKIYMPRVYRRWGTVALCQGDWQEALDVFDKGCKLAQELGQPFDDALFKLGQAYACLAQEKHEQASRLFEMAIHLLEPSHWADATGLWFLLAGLERACADWGRFRGLCQRLRLDHPEAPRASSQQWYLVPAMIQTVGEPWVWETFTEPLSPDWVWTDVFGDCSYGVHDGLDICAANGRGMWHINRSAPRVLRQTSGDFVVQAACVPAMDDRPAIGGLLLWKDKENYLRLARGILGKQEITFGGCVDDEDVGPGRGSLYEASGHVLLRLGRIGDQVKAFCSADGEQWYAVGQVAFPVQDPVQIGVHAIGDIHRAIYPGAYPEGTAIRFESFQMWKVSD